MRVASKVAKEVVWAGSPPLVAAILHHVPDLKNFLNILTSTGIRKGDIYLSGPPYTFRREVAGSLASEGFNVIPPGNSEDPVAALDGATSLILNKVISRCETEQKKFIILEDGGYLVPTAHVKFPGFERHCLGAVEQTTNGVSRDLRADAENRLRIPVVAIPECQLKQAAEPPFIGEAISRNLQIIANDLGKALKTLRVGIVGYGPIGRAVALNFRAMGVDVTVADKDLVRQLQARLEGPRTAWSLVELVRECDIVVGATGAVGAFPIGELQLLEAKNGILFVSASSKQVEFDLKRLRELSVEAIERNFCTHYKLKNGKEVIVAFNGQPVNFQLTFSLPEQIVDLVYDLIIDSARFLAGGTAKPGICKCLADEQRVAALYFQEYDGRMPGL